jgi:hypothetical protein
MPLNEANGPSETRTCSPISKDTLGFGRSNAFLNLAQDALGLRIRNRHRPGIRTKKAGHFRRVLDQMECLVGQIGADQNVAGKELALCIDLASAPDFHDLFGRHENLLECRCDKPFCLAFFSIDSATFFSKFE